MKNFKQLTIIMKTLELADTNTGIDWWDACRELSNKAVKHYNKCIKGKKSISKLNIKCQRIYEELLENAVDYSSDWDVIRDYLEENNEDVSWYTYFNK